jgi:hypothetical protein
VYGNKCLDANGQGASNDTQVIIWDCNNQPNQQWNVNSNGAITGVQSGLCSTSTPPEPRAVQRSSSGRATAARISSGASGN